MNEPLRYEDLSENERAWLCNGCGPKLSIDVVPDFIFSAACNRHDFDYWRGFTRADRYAADRRFLTHMRAAAAAQSTWWARWWYDFLAYRYYLAVRWFGESEFYFRDHYGTREDLEQEMLGAP